MSGFFWVFCFFLVVVCLSCSRVCLCQSICLRLDPRFGCLSLIFLYFFFIFFWDNEYTLMQFKYLIEVPKQKQIFILFLPKYEIWWFPHCQRPHVDCKMTNNNCIIVLLLCFTHYKLEILPNVQLLYILSLRTCYNISVATSLTRRVLHCLCECMKIGYIYVILCIVHVQYTPSVSTIKLSGPTYSSQNVRQTSDKLESQHGLSPTIWSDILVGRESGY